MITFAFLESDFSDMLNSFLIISSVYLLCFWPIFASLVPEDFFLTRGLEMIDTLKYSRELEAAGFNPKQAELFVRSQMGMIVDNVVTKSDLRDIRDEIADVRGELKAEIKDVNHRIDLVVTKVTEMDKNFKARLKGQSAEFNLKVEKVANKLGLIVVSSTTLLIAGLGLFLKGG